MGACHSLFDTWRNNTCFFDWRWIVIVTMLSGLIGTVIWWKTNDDPEAYVFYWLAGLILSSIYFVLVPATAIVLALSVPAFGLYKLGHFLHRVRSTHQNDKVLVKQVEAATEFDASRTALIRQAEIEVEELLYPLDDFPQRQP